MTTTNSEENELRASVRKEVTQQAAKWLTAFAVGAFGLAATGWWLYLKPKLQELAGGVPPGLVAAFDVSKGCPSVGWEPVADLAGKAIIGVGRGHGIDNTELSNRRYREEGGAEVHVLTIAELAAHSHEGSVVGRWGGDRPAHIHPGNLATTPSAIGRAGGGQAHNNMPPFLALHYCKKL